MDEGLIDRLSRFSALWRMAGILLKTGRAVIARQVVHVILLPNLSSRIMWQFVFYYETKAASARGLINPLHSLRGGGGGAASLYEWTIKRVVSFCSGIMLSCSVSIIIIIVMTATCSGVVSTRVTKLANRNTTALHFPPFDGHSPRRLWKSIERVHGLRYDSICGPLDGGAYETFPPILIKLHGMDNNMHIINKDGESSQKRFSLIFMETILLVGSQFVSTTEWPLKVFWVAIINMTLWSLWFNGRALLAA